MQVRIRNQQDFAAGLLFIAIAAGALWVGWDYPTGTAARMSAGFFPRLLGGLLLLLGAIVLIGALRSDGPAISAVRLRPLVIIPLAVVAFGFACAHLGFVAASILLVVFGGLASPQIRWHEVILAALILTLIAATIFIWAIALPIPLWPDL